MFSAAKLPKKAKSRLSAANFFPRDQRRPGRQRCGAGRQWLWRGRLQRPGFGGLVSGRHRFRRHRPCPGSTFACNHTRVRPGAAVGAGSVSYRGQKRSTPGISRGACVPAAVGSSELPAQRVPWSDTVGRRKPVWKIFLQKKIFDQSNVFCSFSPFFSHK